MAESNTLNTQLLILLDKSHILVLTQLMAATGYETASAAIEFALELALDKLADKPLEPGEKVCRPLDEHRSGTILKVEKAASALIDFGDGNQMWLPVAGLIRAQRRG